MVELRNEAIRAMTDEGSFRVIVLDAPLMVQETAASQVVNGPTALLLGRLLLSAVLVRQTMSPAHRVQLALHHDGSPVLRVDSFPDGSTRALANVPEGETLRFTGKTFLEVMRTLHNGQIHRSLTELSHPDDFSRGMMAYMHDSEQILTHIAVDCWGDVSGDLSAVGYLLQVLPEPDEGKLMVMTERLVEFQDIREAFQKHGRSVTTLTDEIFYGMPFTELERPDIFFGCQCSEARVVGALATLGRDEIEQVIRDGEVIEIDCDYCRKHYAVGPALLRTLLVRN